MKLLLDTHVKLWLIADDPKLDDVARAALTDATNIRWLSPISLFEIAIKVQLKKLPLTAPCGQQAPSDSQHQPVTHAHHLPPRRRHPSRQPLKGLERYENAPVDRIRSATRRAFSRLIDLAINKKVDFLLIAGDLYDGDWRDYQTGLYLGRELARLRDHNIPAYVIAAITMQPTR